MLVKQFEKSETANTKIVTKIGLVILKKRNNAN